MDPVLRECLEPILLAELEAVLGPPNEGFRMDGMFSRGYGSRAAFVENRGGRWIAIDV